MYYSIYNCATGVFRGLIISRVLQSSPTLNIKWSLAATRHRGVVPREQFRCANIPVAIAWGQSNSDFAIHHRCVCSADQ
jgi:hypothetical protein